MTDEELTQSEAAYNERLQSLQKRGVQVNGLDMVKLQIYVECLMTEDQQRTARERFVTTGLQVLTNAEPAVARAVLLDKRSGNNGPPLR